MAELTGAVPLQVADQVANVVATPEQVILLAMGALLVLVSSAVFGVLALGGVVDFIAGLLPSGEPPRQAR